MRKGKHEKKTPLKVGSYMPNFNSFIANAFFNSDCSIRKDISDLLRTLMRSLAWFVLNVSINQIYFLTQRTIKQVNLSINFCIIILQYEKLGPKSAV